MEIKWEHQTAENGAEYEEAVINDRTVTIVHHQEGDREWWTMDVDGCEVRDWYRTFAEAEREAIEKATKAIELRITTMDKPHVHTHDHVSGWGDGGHMTILKGDIGEIDIIVNDNERYGLRVEEGQLTLTAYNKPLHMTVDRNLQLSTDDEFFSRMKGSVQHQDDMVKRLCDKLGRDEAVNYPAAKDGGACYTILDGNISSR